MDAHNPEDALFQLRAVADRRLHDPIPMTRALLYLVHSVTQLLEKPPSWPAAAPYEAASRTAIDSGPEDYDFLDDVIPKGQFNARVWSAVRTRDASAVRALTQDPRWDPNLRAYGFPDGGTILHMAAAHATGNNYGVLHLVATGANIESEDEQGRTALMVCQHAAAFHLLVGMGADTRHCDVNGRNCWHLAIASAKLDVLSWLPNADPNADANLSVEDKLGHTPLGGPDAQELAVKCIQANDADSLDLLLGNGILDQRPPSDGSPTAKTLFAKRISVHQRPNNGGPTLLEVACERGVDYSTFKKVLDFADPKSLDDVDDKSLGLIHHLIPWSEGRNEKLKLLLDKGASPDLMPWGKSPALVSYIVGEQFSAAMILLDKGADPAKTTVFGVDATLAAASRGRVEILRRIQSIVPRDFSWGRTCETRLTVNYPTGAETTTVPDCTALHLAAWNGADDVLRFYFDNFKADVNHAISDGSLPIHFAAVSGSVTCVSILHEQKADLTAQRHDGSTALHLAVYYNHAPVVQELLKMVPGLSTMSNNKGLTPFMNALQYGSPQMIGIFTDCQILPSKPTNALVGQVVDKLIRFGDSALCDRLLSKINGIEFEACPLLCDCTPVMLALHEKKPAMLKLLVEWGFNGFRGKCSTHFDEAVDTLNTVCQDPEQSEALLDPLLSSYLEGNDWTVAPVSPIHAAAKYGNHEAIRTILQHIREREDEYRREFCFGYVQPTANISLSEMIRHVLNQATTPGSDFVPGSTPFHISATNGTADVTKLLLESGADVHAQDEENDSPLHNAVKSGHGHILKVLLDNGANPYRAHGHGFAPLMVAVDRGDLSMTRALVEAGAPLDIRDMDGMSLLNRAAENGKPEICDYLIQKNLDPYARDKSGYMPVDDMTLKHEILDYSLQFELERLQELPKGRLSLIIELNRKESVSMLRTLLQRLPYKAKEMTNFYPQRFVTPLCAAVYRDVPDAIDVLVEHGADVNLEGSAEGTPLMTACLRGRLDSVKLLVRHRALLAYRNQTGTVRNAIDVARQFPEIRRWLLVGQFTEQKRLRHVSSADLRVWPWSGVWTAACVLWNFAELPRNKNELQEQFGTRKIHLKERLRGTVVKDAKLGFPLIVDGAVMGG